MIKWSTPFLAEPTFWFSHSAQKAHLSITAGRRVLQEFQGELTGCDTTRNFLKTRFDQPLPGALIDRIARRQLELVKARTDDGVPARAPAIGGKSGVGRSPRISRCPAPRGAGVTWWRGVHQDVHTPPWRSACVRSSNW